MKFYQKPDHFKQMSGDGTEDPIQQLEASLCYLGPQILNMLLIHDAPFPPPFDRSRSPAPTLGPSLYTVTLSDEIPPPAALLGPRKTHLDVRSRLPPRPVSGRARRGTRRTPRPGRARQPDLLPLKGSGPDGGVAPELRRSPHERQAALRAPGDQVGRC